MQWQKDIHVLPEAKLRPTGSAFSGVKVGLPHEMDFILEIVQGIQNEWEDIRDLFQDTAEEVCRQTDLTNGMDSWNIYLIYRHAVGVCLVMHCYNDKGIQNHRTVGVTVDVVPVHLVKPNQIKKLAIHSHHGYCAHNRSKHGYDVLTPNAATFLPFSWVRVC